jgi:FMN phosphatase YigB (HAD superfamily)
MLKAILHSTTWFDYERGRHNQQECYGLLGKEFSLDPADIEQAFSQARDSLQPNRELIAFIRELKSQSNGQLRIFAMSNISAPDYHYLRAKSVDWSIFDDIFPSGIVGKRKPDLCFFRHVIDAANLEPHRTVFVDDNLDNVLSARSLGFQGLVFNDTQNVMRALRNLVGDPVTRGRRFLSQHAGNLHSASEDGEDMRENFSQLLILSLTKDL